MADSVLNGVSANFASNTKTPKKYHNVQSEDFKTSLSKKIQENQKINSTKQKIIKDIKQDGIEIARQKEMKNFSIAIEKALLSKMWQGVFSSVTHEHEETKTISDFHSGMQVDAMVSEMFGEDGGPVADAIYEKLVSEYEQNKKRSSDVKRSYSKNH